MKIKLKIECDGTLTNRHVTLLDTEVVSSSDSPLDISKELESASKFIEAIKKIVV